MFRVSEVVNNSRNQSLFRQVSRQSVGDGYNPQDGDRMFFGYQMLNGRQKDLVAVASYTRADRNITQPDSTDFMSKYNHVLTFLMVKSRYQGKGYGQELLKRVEADMRRHCKRPVRLDSAYGSVKFFQKHGYEVVEEQVLPESYHYCGFKRFDVLVKMEKKVL